MNVIKLQRFVRLSLHTDQFPAVRQNADVEHGHGRKYPQFQQDEIFGLQDAFRKLDVDDKGYVDEATAIRGVQSSEKQPYDVVRQALREVELDSSRRVELEDYVGVRSTFCQCWVKDLAADCHELYPAHVEAPHAIARSTANVYRSHAS